MLGFWAEHLNEDHSNDALKGYVVSIDDLEQKTGIDFFCNLPDDVEEQLEATKSEDIISAWGL
jgi:endonuclease G